MAKKKTKVIQFQPISLGRYIKENARKMPIVTCLKMGMPESGMSHIVIGRQKKNGQILAGFYLVDHLCLGLKDTFYREFDDLSELRDTYIQDAEAAEHTSDADPVYCMNLIYGAIEWAEEAGFKPAKDFSVTEYLLDDVETLEYIEIEFGINGRHFYIQGEFDRANEIINTLTKNLGEGNFDSDIIFSEVDNFIEKDSFYFTYIEDVKILRKQLDKDFDKFIKKEEAYNDKVYGVEQSKNLLFLSYFSSTIWLLMNEDVNWKEKYYENSEEAIQNLKTKLLNPKYKLDFTHIDQLDDLQLDAIVLNNFIFNDCTWTYLPEFKNFILDHSKGKTTSFLPFMLPPLHRALIFAMSATNEYSLTIYGEKLSGLDDEKIQEALEKVVDLYYDFEKNEEIDENFEYLLPYFTDLNDIFTYFKLPNKKELIQHFNDYKSN